jgi:hypothetical protein
MRDWTRQSNQKASGSDLHTPQVGPGKSTRVSELEASATGPVQAKAQPSTGLSGVQRKAVAELTESIWLKAFQGAPEEGAVPAEALSASGGGAAMPAAVQAKMEHAFGADLSAVRIHEGPQAASIGAAAYTRGTDIHFAPGHYDPSSERGQELLGHELTHVVQQSHGRVSAPVQGKGAVTINSDAGLEHEADVLGARAARGERVFGGGGGAGGAGGAVQRKPDGKDAKDGADHDAGAAGGAKRELTDADLPLLYPPDKHIPVSLSAFSRNVIQPAYIAKRPLAVLPFMIGKAYHEHIFFEDGLAPPNVGFMGSNGLGQDATGGYTRERGGLDDALMRQAVANVGDPGTYSLLGNNCQRYVARVLAEYERLHAARH